jgi:hypothetical protein
LDKKYQVFVSSTYSDLQEERQEVMQALLELDCIPAGMELFPAANEDQWTLIKKVIDDCDYYLVIIAGRYGSIGPDGLGYTEMEYRYALDAGKPVIGFVHKNPGSLPANRCEAAPNARQRLDTFKSLVQNKMCRFWDSPADLGSQVSRSLIKLMKSHPAVGWVRGDLVPDESTAEQILLLKKQIETLQAKLDATSMRAPEGTAALAQGSDIFEFHYTLSGSRTTYRSEASVSWDEIFAAVSPIMIDEAREPTIRSALSRLVSEKAIDELLAMEEDQSLRDFSIKDEDFQTIKVQLRALGLITKSTKSRSVKDSDTYWTLTSYGDTVMTRLRALRRQGGPERAMTVTPEPLVSAAAEG